MEASITHLHTHLQSSLILTPPPHPTYSQALKATDSKVWAHCLIATPIAETGVTKEIMAKALTSCFQLYKTLKVITLKSHDSVVILRFTNDRDMLMVLNNGPWSVFGQLLLMLPFNKDKDKPEEVVFSQFSIWFGMKNLPLTSRSADHLLEIVEDIMDVGLVRPRFIHELDDPEYFRVQGLFQRDVVLPAGRLVKNEVGEEQYVSFHYEKLPLAFCKICRTMGHDYIVCPLRKERAKPHSRHPDIASGSETGSGNMTITYSVPPGVRLEQDNTAGVQNNSPSKVSTGGDPQHPHLLALSDHILVHKSPALVTLKSTQPAPQVSTVSNELIDIEKNSVAQPSHTTYGTSPHTSTGMLGKPTVQATGVLIPDTLSSSATLSFIDTPELKLASFAQPGKAKPGRGKRTQRPATEQTARQAQAAVARQLRLSKRKILPPSLAASKKQKPSDALLPSTSHETAKTNAVTQAVTEADRIELGTPDNSALGLHHMSSTNSLQSQRLSSLAQQVATTVFSQAINWDNINQETINDLLLEEGVIHLGFESVQDTMDIVPPEGFLLNPRNQPAPINNFVTSTATFMGSQVPFLGTQAIHQHYDQSSHIHANSTTVSLARHHTPGGERSHAERLQELTQDTVATHAVRSREE